MSLRDLVDRKSTIRDDKSGVEFQVRGLSLQDVVLLLENHKAALVEVFAGESGTDFEQLIQKFPAFIAAAIAYAADEHDLEEQVAKLPIGVQLRAVQEVWELSSLDVETVGKLAQQMVTSVARLNSEHLDHLQTTLKSGSDNLQRAQNS
jgi:hypothetical protein